MLCLLYTLPVESTTPRNEFTLEAVSVFPLIEKNTFLLRFINTRFTNTFLFTNSAKGGPGKRQKFKLYLRFFCFGVSQVRVIVVVQLVRLVGRKPTR